MKQRKIPIRTCVACRTTGDKSSLIRIVRTPSGEILVDLTGKMPGRGAYLCPSLECLRRARKEKKLSRALRAEISEETVQRLEEIMKQGSDKM
jgi:predicted RNA-binding protein YlxR (DUF448 family)